MQLGSVGKGEPAASVKIRIFFLLSPITFKGGTLILSKLSHHCSVIFSSSSSVREEAGGEAGFSPGPVVGGEQGVSGRAELSPGPLAWAVQHQPSPLSRVCACALGGFGDLFPSFKSRLPLMFKLVGLF